MKDCLFTMKLATLIRFLHQQAELLMRVHHRNLMSLIGYFKEGANVGLIYEYMARGNLRMHLSGIKSWPVYTIVHATSI